MLAVRKKEVFNAFKIYVFTWLVAITLFLNAVADNGRSIKKVFIFFLEALGSTPFLVVIHLLFLAFFISFLTLRYFFNMYLKIGLKTTLKAFLLRCVTPLLTLFLIFRFVSYNNSNEVFNYQWDHSTENHGIRTNNLFAIDGKHRGMSVFGWHTAQEDEIMALVRNNVEWVAVIPFCYQKDDKTKEMNVPEEVGKWSRRDSTFIRSIEQLSKKGIRIQLKPHLWMNSGWRSNIQFATEAAWDTWFESYRKNMLHYATMAEITKTELLCIGTELKSSLKNQPQSWLNLIKEIKTIYCGKLTYAANWDDPFDQNDFWKELDYIGVQAYFPLTKTNNPQLEEIIVGWERHIKKLDEISTAHDKPILFTEVGYKSEASSTIKPWEWSSVLGMLHKKKSFRTQQQAYEAMFRQLWRKDWFAGTYIWQWDTRSTEENAKNDLDFSPRFKPAENTLAKWYGKHPNQ